MIDELISNLTISRDNYKDALRYIIGKDWNYTYIKIISPYQKMIIQSTRGSIDKVIVLKAMAKISKGKNKAEILKILSSCIELLNGNNYIK